MKTLHLTNAWHPSSGGIATFYRALMRAAEERGHWMRIVVPSEMTRVEEVGRYGRIYHLEAPPAPFNQRYRVLLPHRYLFADTAICRLIRSEQPDLVEICDKYTLIWMSWLLKCGGLLDLKKRPKLVGMSCERMDDNIAAYTSTGRAGQWLSRCYMRMCYVPMFDYHITVSDYTAGELVAAADSSDGPDIWIRPMGVDLSAFSPAHRTAEKRKLLLERVGGGGNSVLLLYAGRLVPEKNLDLLVELMGSLHHDQNYNYRLLIAGDGLSEEELQRTCEERFPGKVSFLGHFGNRSELAALYANADIFVHPNWKEPFGIGPLEAMAAGTPLVAPNTGGVVSYANPWNAWVADPRPAAFASAVRAAVANPELMRRKVQAAIETAQRYDWPRVAGQFLQLYESIHALAPKRSREESERWCEDRSLWSRLS